MKEKYYRKSRLGQSKISGFIYLVLFILIIFILRGIFRICYYSSSITPNEYQVSSIRQETSTTRDRETGSSTTTDYDLITIQYKVNGKLVTAYLKYTGTHKDSLYRIWVTGVNNESNPVTEPEECLGRLYYHKEKPEKLIQNRFFW